MEFLKWDNLGEIAMAIAATFKGSQWIGKYFETKNNNEAKVKIASIEEDKELTVKYKEALRTINDLTLRIKDLESDVLRAAHSLKMLNTLLRKHFEGDQAMLSLIDQAEAAHALKFDEI